MHVINIVVLPESPSSRMSVWTPAGAETPDGMTSQHVAALDELGAHVERLASVTPPPKVMMQAY